MDAKTHLNAGYPARKAKRIAARRAQRQKDKNQAEWVYGAICTGARAVAVVGDKIKAEVCRRMAAKITK